MKSRQLVDFRVIFSIEGVTNSSSYDLSEVLDGRSIVFCPFFFFSFPLFPPTPRLSIAPDCWIFQARLERRKTENELEATRWRGPRGARSGTVLIGVHGGSKNRPWNCDGDARRLRNTVPTTTPGHRN